MDIGIIEEEVCSFTDLEDSLISRVVFSDLYDIVALFDMIELIGTHECR